MRRKCLVVILALLSLTAALAVAQTKIVEGQLVTITVRLTDENGGPIAGVLVHFLDETDGVEIGTDTTDSNGYASVVWDTSSASAGTHSILIWTEEADYVESTQTRVSIEILTPAELRLSVTAPAAVRPGSSFVVRATVSNVGQAAAQEVVVSLDGQAKSIGDLEGGKNTSAEFTTASPDEPGDYSLTLQASGTEWGTGRLLSATARVYYRVKMEGIALKIRAPYSVREGETFSFSVDVSNVGESPVSVSIFIELRGAEPSEVLDSTYLEPGSNQALTYEAKAEGVEEIEIIAEARGGGLRATDRATIAVIPSSPPLTQQPNATSGIPPPTERPSDLISPQDATSQSALAQGYPEVQTPERQGYNQDRTISVNISVARGRAETSLSTAPVLAGGGSGGVVLLIAVLRGIWRVNQR